MEAGHNVTVDNLLYSPIYVLAFFAYGCMAIDGLGPAAFAAKMKEEFLPTMVTEALMWPPYMAAVFSRVPVKHQLLAVNVATLFDVCFLSWVRTKHEQEQPHHGEQQQQQLAPAAAKQGQQKQQRQKQPQQLPLQQQEEGPPRSVGEARRRELSACLWDSAPEPSLGHMALMAASATMAPHGGGGVRRRNQE
ncbi:Protein SYM1 [Tetrabaena socialis]|uniref:Protein SYM1 n=1 Tax=Tetrabaena socialis TaxID=47790 RepID=A0A2J8A4A3_9CHLO|nr:Protein SYM1 [Tetrabaena socialis]|eukprot:PNH07346.1 Protein SYM1 [Tetrabaena socialis]